MEGKLTEGIDIRNALRQRYALRTVGPEGKYFEVALPKEVVEREAHRNSMTIKEFVDKFEVEALYDSFEGIHYHFVLKIA